MNKSFSAGNECSKVLKNLNQLEDVIPSDFLAFVDLMVSFRNVLDSCLGSQLDPYYKDRICDFSTKLDIVKEKFGMTESNKLHTLRVHVSEFCDETKESLGKYSEQELENTHSAYEAVWERYKVKYIKNSNYASRQHQAIMCFNSYNI